MYVMLQPKYKKSKFCLFWLKSRYSHRIRFVDTLSNAFQNIFFRVLLTAGLDPERLIAEQWLLQNWSQCFCWLNVFSSSWSLHSMKPDSRLLTVAIPMTWSSAFMNNRVRLLSKRHFLFQGNGGGHRPRIWPWPLYFIFQTIMTSTFWLRIPYVYSIEVHKYYFCRQALPLIISISLHVDNICEIVHLFLLKSFWFILSFASMCKLILFRNINILFQILAATDCSDVIPLKFAMSPIPPFVREM